MLFTCDPLTRTWSILLQTPHRHLAIAHDRLLALRTSHRTDRALRSRAAVAALVTEHTKTRLIEFVLRTRGHTELVVLDVQTGRTVLGSRTVARMLALRVTWAAMRLVHLIDVRQTETGLQTCAVVLEVLALQTLIGARAPASIRCTLIVAELTGRAYI